VIRTPLSRSKGQRSRSPGRFTHRGVYAQAAAAVSVGTCWAWETAATLPSAGAWSARRREDGEERDGGISCRHAHSLFKLFSPPDSPSFSFLEAVWCYPIWREIPLAWASNIRGWKNLRFRLKSPSTSEWYEISPWLLWNVNRKSYMWRIDSCRFRRPWVTLKGGTRDQIFRRISLITLVPFDLERPNSAG